MKKRDKLIYEKSKLASIGELLKNVAHQWRQPLSAITIGATGILLQKSSDLLTDNYLEKTCEKINENAQRLSLNIDQFLTLVKDDETKTLFYLDENIKKMIHILDPVIKVNNVEIILNIENNILVEGFYSELLKSLSNIVNNSIDAIQMQKNLLEHLVFITAVISDDKIIITIKDNGGGIDENILPKIFDAYFTTKEHINAKGLGLYYTYNNIINGMDGKIEISNTQYNYRGTLYKGANFKITIPLKQIEITNLAEA